MLKETQIELYTLRIGFGLSDDAYVCIRALFYCTYDFILVAVFYLFIYLLTMCSVYTGTF